MSLAQSLPSRPQPADMGNSAITTNANDNHSQTQSTQSTQNNNAMPENNNIPNPLPLPPGPPPSQPTHLPPGLKQATLAIHADDHLPSSSSSLKPTSTPHPSTKQSSIGTDVAPAMHVSTTFHLGDNPEELVPFWQIDDWETFDRHIYSRDTAPNATRFEAVLETLLGGRVVSYGSGLAGYFALLAYLNPKRISVGDSYHGCHGVISVISRLSGLQKLPIDCPAEDLQPGDIIHVETPMNPTGEAVCIASYAEKAHSRGAYLLVDATFGPPGLQDPFEWGADIVFHSGTKYLGGHSDMLCGVLAVRREDWFWGLRADRCSLGSVMGSFEGWLGLRSLRTLELRVQRQSHNAEMLIRWLYALLHPDDPQRGSTAMAGDDPTLSSGNSTMVRKVLAKVCHASLQLHDSNSIASNGTPETASTPRDEPLNKEWLKKQMPNGFGPVFAIWMTSEDLAKRLPGRLKLFHHATSLGGVESLIEWRHMTDHRCDAELLRISVGVEHWTDLRADLLRGFEELAAELPGEEAKGEKLSGNSDSVEK